MQRWIRTLTWSGISLLFLFCLFFASLQTRYIKEKLRFFLVQASQQVGIPLQIEKIKGSVPLRWTLKKVVLEPTPQDRIEIPELRFSISLFSLLRGELAFKRIFAKNPLYTFSAGSDFALPQIDLPFTISCKELILSNLCVENKLTETKNLYSIYAKGHLLAHSVKFLANIAISMPSSKEALVHLYTAGSLHANHIAYTLDVHLPSMQSLSPFFQPPFDGNLSLSANVSSSWDGHVDVAFAALSLKNFECFNERIQGDLALDLSLSNDKARLGFSTHALHVDEHPFENFKVEWIASKAENHWEGTGILLLEQEALFLKGKTQFDYADNHLHIKDISSEGMGLVLNGSLNMHLLPFTLEGGLYGYLPDLSPFAKWAPEERLGGSLAMSLRLKRLEDSTATFIAKNLDCALLFAQDLCIEMAVCDLWNNPEGMLSVRAERIYSPRLSLSSFSATTSLSPQPWEFSIVGQGLWKDPLTFSILGSWHKELEGATLSFQEVTATIFKHPITLENPFSISWEKQYITLTPCTWTLGNGTLFATADLSEERSEIILKSEHFPLDLLALSYPEFTLAGTCSLEASLTEQQSNPQGTCSLVLEKAHIFSSGKLESLNAKGNLQLNLENHRLQMHSTLKASGAQFLDWTASLPIQGSIFPFSLHIDKELPLSSEIVMEGNLEEIFDFINIGSHQISGLLSCHLHLSKNFLAPSLLGKIELHHGIYENYVTGTVLKEIEAVALAENNQILLTTFQAKDEEKGEVFAAGHLNLETRNFFPYEVFLHFDDLNILNYDSFTSNFTGPLHVKGNRKRMYAEGSLEVPEARFHIPDELPIHVPTLPITYIHQPFHVKKNQVAAPSLFPIDLNIELTANKKVFVRGRGLNSEWDGHVRLDGTNQDVSANGSLHLLKGEFVFSGKIFSLTQGEITFAHKTTQEAFLSLSGILNLPDVTITAMLRGPLSSPQLSFQSVPHMPTSSILARILFNKDISEISAFQAIQIAQALVTLSGGAGPDVLETIRKSLGVDRLNIVSSQSDPDAISVQIGKYLTRGVMVTLSQSADSSQVIVEVDLSQGFIFQAETQEEEEGKFTLKWNRNY